MAREALRWSVRLLRPTAPELALKLAERAFLTAPRHRRPAWEAAALEGARPWRVPFAGGHLPAWTWEAERADAKTALLVHGWEGRGSQLASFVAPLRARGFRVVTFDAPGHGESAARTSSAVHIALAVERMVHALSHSGTGVDAIVAHSVGGAATALALHLGSVPASTRMVFVCPPLSPARFAGAFASFLGLDPAERRELEARIERRLGVGLHELDVTRVAHEFTSPLLLIHDAEDREIPFADAVKFSSAWPGAKLLRTEGLGHRRILRAPEVLRAAAEFAAGHPMTWPALPPGSLEAELFDRDTRFARR
jgi:pimeloyl-ACP methyl ester carboxylesterase